MGCLLWNAASTSLRLRGKTESGRVRLRRSRFPAAGQAWGSDSVTQRVAPSHVVTEKPPCAEGVSLGVTAGTGPTGRRQIECFTNLILKSQDRSLNGLWQDHPEFPFLLLPQLPRCCC